MTDTAEVNKEPEATVTLGRIVQTVLEWVFAAKFDPYLFLSERSLADVLRQAVSRHLRDSERHQAWYQDMVDRGHPEIMLDSETATWHLQTAESLRTTLIQLGLMPEDPHNRDIGPV